MGLGFEIGGMVPLRSEERKKWEWGYELWIWVAAWSKVVDCCNLAPIKHIPGLSGGLLLDWDCSSWVFCLYVDICCGISDAQLSESLELELELPEDDSFGFDGNLLLLIDCFSYFSKESSLFDYPRPPPLFPSSPLLSLIPSSRRLPPLLLNPSLSLS